MFTYIDATVRERLLAEGKLFRLDGSGRPIDSSSAAEFPEGAIDVLGPIPLPLPLAAGTATAEWYAAVRRTELADVEQLAAKLRQAGGERQFAHTANAMAVNSVLLFPGDDEAKDPLVRVHSNCLTGDVFGSMRCECGPQLTSAIEELSNYKGRGMLVYMAGHEGRGIGLWAKAATYLLQDAGEDTYSANRLLGLPEDSRDFSDAAALIRFFIGERAFRLMTNNPKKIGDLESAGLGPISPEKHVVGVSEWNSRYLRAKREWGHEISDADIDEER